MLNNFQFIKKMTEAHSPSGSEEEVRELVKEELKNSCTFFDYDNLGSIICGLTNNKKFKVAIMAHLDEVGYLVENITKDGKIKLFQLGGIDPVIALNSVVTIKTYSNKKIYGVVMSNVAAKDTKLENLYIDINCETEQEARSMGIEKGDSVTFSTETIYLNNGDILAKALDDRIGCVLGIELLKEFANSKLSYDLYFVGTVQEEIGTRGGKTAIEKLKPDLVINLDVATAKENTRMYKKGPCLVIADKLALGNKHLLHKFIDIGKKKGINYQLDFLKGGGTDNGPASNHGIGIPGISIILPVKNCHTPNTIVNEQDYLDTFNLLKEFFVHLNDESSDNKI